MLRILVRVGAGRCPWRALLLLAALAAGLPAAQTYHVDAALGNDSYTGTSATVQGSVGPWRTLGRTQWAGVPGPGVTVLVASGTYAASSPGGIPLWLNAGGSATAPMTYAARPGHRPVITGSGWAGIGSANASWIVIDGFTITGPSPDPSSWLAAATANGSATTADRLYNGNGIAFDGRNQGSAFPHHITIRNCSVSRWGGAGISLILTDYVTVEDCTVFDNSWYTRYATSGISIGGRDYDGDTGYRNIIRRNTVFNNFTQVPWSVLVPPAVSDGNGIIVDDNRNTQANKGYTVPYTGRTLISDNLVVGNGGSGIHAYLSDRVDIVRNTAYMNSRMLDYGEIFAIQCSDVRIMDNILWGRPGRIITKGSSQNTAVVQDANIYHGDGAVSLTPGPADRRTDPLLRSPGLDPATWDFRLLGASPARDSASATFAGISPGDITRAPRPVGAGGDRGAYEFRGDTGPAIVSATAAPPAMTLP